MSDYPNIHGGDVIAQFPYRPVQAFRTTAEDGECGQRYARAERTAYALCRWELTYSELTETEVAALVAHFVAMGGRRGMFSFTCPRTSEVHAGCRYDMDRIDIQHVGRNRCRTTIIIQEHA